MSREKLIEETLPAEENLPAEEKKKKGRLSFSEWMALVNEESRKVERRKAAPKKKAVAEKPKARVAPKRAAPPLRPETVTEAVRGLSGGGALGPPPVEMPFKKPVPRRIPVPKPEKPEKTVGLVGSFIRGVFGVPPEGKVTGYEAGPTVMEAVRGYPMVPPEEFHKPMSHPSLRALREKAGVPPAPTLPPSDPRAYAAGKAAGGLLALIPAARIGGAIGRVGLRLAAPRLATGTGLGPRVAQTAAEGLPTGALWGGGLAALEGKPAPEVAAEALRSGLFFGTGFPAGTAAEAVTRKVLRDLPENLAARVAAALARGGTAGAVGTAAELPTYPAEERPSATEVLTQAGTLAAWEAIAGLLSRPAPRRTARPVEERTRQEVPRREERKPAVQQIERAFGEELKGILPEPAQKAGLSVQLVRGPQAASGRKFAFASAEVEARWQAAKELPKESVLTKAREAVRSVLAKATREFEHLPRTAEFSELRAALLRLQKQKDVAADRTFRLQQGITAKLNEQTYDLFSRKVILDDMAADVKAGLYEGREMPFGFTKESFKQEKARVDAAAASIPEVQEAVLKRRRLWDAVRHDYIKAMKAVGFDPSEKLKRPDYFRHFILEHAEAAGVFGMGKRLKTPTYRGFLRERKGSEKDYLTDYLQAEHTVLAQMLHDIEVARAIKKIDKSYNIAGRVKQRYIQALEKLLAELGYTPEQVRYGMRQNGIPKSAYESALKNKIRELDEKALRRAGLEDWRQMVPEGYTIWQPRRGNIFYLADSIPAQLAERLYADKLLELGITRENLRKVLAVGQKHKEFVVKEEIAKTLDNLSIPEKANPLSESAAWLTRKWKVWTLISPTRVVKYNVRNLTGDADALFAGNPSAFKKVPQAVKELRDAFAGRPMSKDLKDWYERGGMQTLLQAQEIGDIKRLEMFQNLVKRKGTWTEKPTEVWQWYWKKARLTTDFREAILRYAAYLDYLGQIKAGRGRPKNFGASIPEEVMALRDWKDRAFKLSNELLGAYDQISVVGQSLRKHLIPFWSWNEVNFRRYKQLFLNAARDKKLARAVGNKLLGTAVKSPLIAYRVGKFAIKAGALAAMLQVWNHLKFPDEEAELPDDVRLRPHIVLGRGDDGKVIYFSRLGALTDLLEWFGLDTPLQDARDFLEGKRTLKEIAQDMAKAPLNKFFNLVTPFIKLPAELATRTKLYPEVTEARPGAIRDVALHVAQSLGLGEEFKRVTGRPSRPYTGAHILVYKVDPGEAAYFHILNEKRRWQKKRGKAREGYSWSAKSNALYNIKLAIRYNDERALKRYLLEYRGLGGTREGLERSLRSLHPLYGLKDEDKKAFIESLSERDAEKLAEAVSYYEKVVLGKEE